VDQIEDLAPYHECARLFPYSFQASGAFTNFVKKERVSAPAYILL
jgi:hypothetical protein